MKNIRGFFKNRSGAGAVEYALLVALIAMTLTSSTSVLGNSINSALSKPLDALASTSAGGSDPGGVAPVTPETPTVPSAPSVRKPLASPFF